MKKDIIKLILKIISVLFIIVCLFCFGKFSFFVFKINIIPNKYLFSGIGIFIILISLLLFLIYCNRKIIVKIISVILMTIFAILSYIASTYLSSTYAFFTGTNKEYDTLNYSVIVLKDSSYSNIESLNNKTISYLKDNYKLIINKNLISKINYNERIVSEFSEISDLLINKETDAIVLEEGYLTLICEEVEDFESKIKIIYTFEVKVVSHKEEGKVSVTEEPFVLYISGIDQYGNVTSVRGRSDVNILAIVNPKTNQILLVNTPRDYYVRLAGTTGYRDKLTHAGIYGIDKSISTLEKLYSINIDYYLRVNFNTLIKVVDVIGGIDIYSDKAFTPWTNRNVYVNYGWNHMTGEAALAYARERKAYATGDNHRGANQQQVITAIIDKVSKSSVLVSKYNSILNTLEGSFQTDMEISTITSFIKYQLDKMPNWTVESVAVTGYNSMDYTYSTGGSSLRYVMEPDYDSIAKVKRKINEVLNEN